LPTKKEFEELIEKCDWTWTILDGHYGYKVISKINGNSIFIPNTDVYIGLYKSDNAGGGYWSATPFERDSRSAYHCFDPNMYISHDVHVGNRCNGERVRPVTD